MTAAALTLGSLGSSLAGPAARAPGPKRRLAGVTVCPEPAWSSPAAALSRNGRIPGLGPGRSQTNGLISIQGDEWHGTAPGRASAILRAAAEPDSGRPLRSLHCESLRLAGRVSLRA